MAKEKSWDDIPSLGLTLDDGSSRPVDHRVVVRLVRRDLQDLLKMPRGLLPVLLRLGHDRQDRTGSLIDISQKGMGIRMRAGHGLARGMVVTLVSRLGSRLFSTRAVVRWVASETVGMKFVDPKKEDYEFLSELYAAKVLGGGF